MMCLFRLHKWDIGSRERAGAGIARGESGITGLETAIVLIAFVIVASIFAYTVLSAGIFSSQKAEEAVDTGVDETGSTVKLGGDVIAHCNANLTSVEVIDFTVKAALETGDSVDLVSPEEEVSSNGEVVHSLVISYYDQDDVVKGIYWSVNFYGGYEGAALNNTALDPGEQAMISVNLTREMTGMASTNTTDVEVGPNESFRLEVKPPKGASFTMERRLPSSLSSIMVLN
ncbi:MAG: archaellin/type IV pilin N-terminal domain-containing protein [Dehalococcoidia bacterium]